MNKYITHIMIYMISVISYYYLNNNPLEMCHLFIKFICCNKNTTDKDLVSEPEAINVPFDDVKKVADSAEHIIDEIIAPQ